MIRALSLILFVAMISCTSQKANVLEQTTVAPIITFDQETIDIGQIKRGDKKDIVYDFTNTGNADLIIELITACKCTSTDWTRGVIAPGGRGQISVTFDSKDQARGPLKKTIDIISNTDPIVMECFFEGVIVE